MESTQKSKGSSKVNNDDSKKNPDRSRATYLAIIAAKGDLGLKNVDLKEITGKSKATVTTWLSNKNIPVGQPIKKDMEAIVHLVAIHRNLFAMFSEKENRKRWLHSNHPALEKSPLELMKQSYAGLIQVRTYLDYHRGRGA